VFGTGLAYSYPEARFTKGYLAVISRAPFPHSILYDRQELVVLKSKLDATGSTFLEYVYASAPTTVTGTNAEGFSFDLDLAQGWNQVVALYRFSTQKIEYRSTIPPGDLVWTAHMQSGQVLLNGKAMQTLEGGDFEFTENYRIVLEYGLGSQSTRLYTPLGKNTFTYVTPLEVTGEQLSDAENLFGSRVTVSGPPDAQFARLYIRVYSTSEGEPIGYHVAELYQSKQEVENRYTLLYQYYSTKDGVTLNGSSTTEGSTETFSNLTLQKGWIIVKGMFDLYSNTITYSNPDASTFEGMEWRVRVQTQ